ncbi:alpha-1,4-glucan--maltose-1-phosphate maltosyltransferase [Arcanobacterium pinnipediorum]|uniref:Alpha-1,4-glucan:maltose-1-phosphate maltosyltransferase n=1 Tax=Arcanobacterium pinnipediorum TaxID=1503041 RepID=A0ABY5AII1_9ACTO|nr:alpha-1,4-glucan--maltose-1-phosphate maltosyltransferase [Arcanobacterium pinnipediorum]USR79738.1 alpha-1,4-glucan--maltose-1-phosphate maltosyltransferase [Arcanobacterium pinnipediorum]
MTTSQRKTSSAPKGSARASSSPQKQQIQAVSRIPIVEVSPQLLDGTCPVKATINESFPVRATVFREGHDKFAATAVLVDDAGNIVDQTLMRDVAPGLFRFEGWLTPQRTGAHHFYIQAWSDPYATWLHNAEIKIPAGIDIDLVFAEAEIIFNQAIKGTPARSAERAIIKDALNVITKKRALPEVKLAAARSAQLQAALAKYPVKELLSHSAHYPVFVDRERALVGSWYEIFPRSIGAKQDPETGQWISGTLRTAAKDLDRIAGMGFDVVYLTPIHPIGSTNRKGRNNTLNAQPGDPGSPYAIGSADGGHDAIEPALGTFEDFDAFVAHAHKLGMEVAMDLALQCSPDHPWVTEHPQWFTTRADGTIAYAENPPKKYQDIYPLNFDNDPEGIYQEIKRILQLWVSHGVSIFRVDNPHTKPVSFWQRLLAEFRQLHPEVIFLAEAFTNPPMMQTLGTVGFHQSYTYFAWRNERQEIEEYLTEVSHESAHRLRPAFWPTTHDILTPYMQRGGIPAFAIRAILAATGSPTWGIYNGYELVENIARPGAEEQVDNEKYEYKPRDYAVAEHNGMAVLLTMLNDIRAKHPALRRLRNVTINPTSDEKIVSFTKIARPEEAPDGHGDAVIVVLNLDPYASREASVYLDLSPFGISPRWDNGPLLEVTDEMNGQTYLWNEAPYVRLDPHGQVAHILSVKVLP